MTPTTEETSDPFEQVGEFFLKAVRINDQLVDVCWAMQLVTTLTHQSHLCPLPLSVQPIIWNYDHCLRLYPTPHTVRTVALKET